MCSSHLARTVTPSSHTPLHLPEVRGGAEGQGWGWQNSGKRVQHAADRGRRAGGQPSVRRWRVGARVQPAAPPQAAASALPHSTQRGQHGGQTPCALCPSPPLQRSRPCAHERLSLVSEVLTSKHLARADAPSARTNSLNLRAGKGRKRATAARAGSHREEAMSIRLTMTANQTTDAHRSPHAATRRPRRCERALEVERLQLRQAVQQLGQHLAQQAAAVVLEQVGPSL